MYAMTRHNNMPRLLSSVCDIAISSLVPSLVTSAVSMGALATVSGPSMLRCT